LSPKWTSLARCILPKSITNNTPQSMVAVIATRGPGRATAGFRVRFAIVRARP
jgi:hypothetical protein